MIANIPTEVVPVWYIEKWTKNNSEDGSILSNWIKRLLKDWQESKDNLSGGHNDRTGTD